MSEGGAPAKVSVKNLDFLRGVAAVYVVFAHARGQFYAGGNALVREAGGLHGLNLHELAIIAMMQRSRSCGAALRHARSGPGVVAPPDRQRARTGAKTGSSRATPARVM